jgi:hypothetical protein
MSHVDLDAARQARAEARGEHPSVTLGGREYKLVPELTIDGGVAYREADARRFVELILADPAEADAFMATGLSWADLTELLAAWRTGSGESSAS